MVLRRPESWNGYGDQAGFAQWLMEGVEDLHRLANHYDGCGMREKLKELVPEYEPQDSECVL